MSQLKYHRSELLGVFMGCSEKEANDKARKELSSNMASRIRNSVLLLATMMLLWTMVLATVPNDSAGDFHAGDESDGGFSSLDGMLQWAIGHSDPDKLKESAEELSIDELKERQLELKKVVEQLKMPADADLMRIAIQDLRNSSLSLQDRHRALNELLILVEPIDNANDLHKLGGLAVVIQELDHAHPDTRKLAAWVLGEASQNNLDVQNQILELGALTKLMKIVKSDVLEEAIKGLYAVSSLIRNNPNGQILFYTEFGRSVLEDLLGNPKTDIRLQKKAVHLVGDLAQSKTQSSGFFTSRVLLKAMVDLVSSSDLDLREKALMAIRSVMQLETSEGRLVMAELRGLKFDVTLEKMKKQLKERSETGEEYERDFMVDLESLRSDVELVFQAKIEKGTTSSTSSLVLEHRL